MSTPLTPQAPLTPEEQQQVARFLSDPFYFPLQFKTWLQWFIESAPGGIAGGGASGGGGGGGVIPIGGIFYWTTPTLPTGLLWTNGGAFSRAAYNALFQVIGTRYGAGDGSTTFNVPDIDGRSIASWAQAGGHADMATLGATEGVAKLYRRLKHQTTKALTVDAQGDHVHSILAGGDVSNVNGQMQGYADANLGYKGTTSTAGAHGHNVTGSIGTNNPNDPVDTPAYIVLPAVIRYI